MWERTLVDKFRDAGNECSPYPDQYERYYHPREHRAMHSHEIWKFGMGIHIAWADLEVGISIGLSLLPAEWKTYKVLIQI